MQADSADGTVIAKSVLRLLGVISGKHDGDVLAVELRAAGRIDASGEEAQSVANHGSVSWDRNRLRTCASSRNAVCINVHGGGEDRGDWVVDPVHYRPMNQIR